MDIRSVRLREAIEQHLPDPGDGKDRAFHRLAKPHVGGRIAASFYALRGYLDGTRPVPDEVIQAAAKVLPVTVDWLNGFDVGGALQRVEKPKPAAPVEDDSYADIRAAVLGAGSEPDDDALITLDPKYPRNGLSRRNWSLLYAVVGEDKP